ncbi:hypothetical protein [Treponema sp.]|uniref:hypothetical protein n=1 Tax=Treponema sp. TaxID=166 RepID=UPI00298D6757|nr:hypothetical protein [Treponema sp.]MCQ2240071.1 hypothetical protein [Treponema sp.]
MEAEKLLELYRNRLSRDFILSEDYEGKRYVLVAEKSVEETKAFGTSELTRTVLILSQIPENSGADYVQSEIEKIPEAALSGFRNISKNKTTFFTRVFLMEKIPFDLIQKARNFDFSRTEQGAFNYIVHAGVMLVERSGSMIYSNKAASQFCNLFKVVTPVEVKDDELNSNL